MDHIYIYICFNIKYLIIYLPYAGSTMVLVPGGPKSLLTSNSPGSTWSMAILLLDQMASSAVEVVMPLGFWRCEKISAHSTRNVRVYRFCQSVTYSSFPPSLLPSNPPWLLGSLAPWLFCSLFSSFPPSLLSSFPPSLLSSFPPFLLSSFPTFLLSSFPPFLLSSFLRSFAPSLLRSFAPSLLRSFAPSLLRSFAPSLLPSFPPALLPSFPSCTCFGLFLRSKRVWRNCTSRRPPPINDMYLGGAWQPQSIHKRKLYVC